MLRDADTAMYRAKASGRNRCIIFDEVMHTRALERLHLESELGQALERRQFQLHYQPIVSLEDETVVGAEALLRWQSPTRGLVSPATFIHVAEETGLIVPVGAWVLQEACSELKRCMNIVGAGSRFAVGVNISSPQFSNANLVDQVAGILNDNQITGDCLRLELTETVAMENPERTGEMLAALQRLGVRIAIDDFGTGYSSLNHLQRFSADILKIDRHFVSHMEIDERNHNIVKTMINLAHNLEMKVVAEGAETAEQVMQLKRLGCDYVQGYFFYRAMPARELEDLLSMRPTHRLEPVLSALKPGTLIN